MTTDRINQVHFVLLTTIHIHTYTHTHSHSLSNMNHPYRSMTNAELEFQFIAFRNFISVYEMDLEEAQNALNVLAPGAPSGERRVRAFRVAQRAQMLVFWIEDVQW